MPKVKFSKPYRNGMVGLDVAAEEVVELTDEQFAYVLTDVRNAKESLEILSPPKKTQTKKAGADDEG